jgi:uncharacterized membrane protein YfcA
MTEEQIRARDNEVTKYIAAAWDRASTAAIAVGIFSSFAAFVSYDHLAAVNWRQLVVLMISTILWLSVARTLHRTGKRLLQKGLR